MNLLKLMAVVIVLATLVVLICQVIKLDGKIKELENKITLNEVHNDLGSVKREIKNDRKLFEELLEQLEKKIVCTHVTTRGISIRGVKTIVDLTDKEKEIKQKEKEIEELKEGI